ncbi:hypothetical protein BU26DRAFT_522891 [Trematosphaeria pertusa]|uniref:Uncharacterized protein n=1 Tax=Trematosphaeria pertusa TaxID=390896 RepID=A0A6A6I2U7_9PLEO|nr:uncharacterized protein BU26DRAFT_522891 [Trematosphaeria pertusa]KAF2244203.1 hypothetical protein BU26DRAFT_522891 [Trematosphaeria pertusa]
MRIVEDIEDEDSEDEDIEYEDSEDEDSDGEDSEDGDYYEPTSTGRNRNPGRVPSILESLSADRHPNSAERKRPKTLMGTIRVSRAGLSLRSTASDRPRTLGPDPQQLSDESVVETSPVPSTSEIIANSIERTALPGSGETVESRGQQALPKHELVKMRDNLRLLILGELCDIRSAHSKSQGPAQMWSKSQELDDLLLAIWKADKEEILLEMGPEKYKNVSDVVDAWLLFRDIARKLGRHAGVHPSEGKPFPQIGYEAWVEKLGGDDKYLELDYQLTEARVELRKSGACRNTAEVAGKLTEAFASATKYANATKAYKKGVTRFNENLFSWQLDF